jgi:hypothetical protein
VLLKLNLDEYHHTGSSIIGSNSCAISISQGAYIGCITDENANASTTGCIVECSRGCSVETPLVMTTDTTSDSDTTATAATTNTTAADDSSTADGFTPIDGDFSPVEIITISPQCPSNEKTTYPKAMFTIMPSTVAYVSSYPANLVTPVVSGSVLEFEWNDTVAKGAENGGVRIGLPPDQFNELSLNYALTAQILSGFTSGPTLRVDGASTLKATLTSSPNSVFSLDVNGASTAHVISNVQGSARSDGASTVKVQAPSLSSIVSNGASKLEVDGNVDGGSVDGASTIFVTGDISGSLSINGASTINANTISGSINSDGASAVNAASCDNVKSGTTSSCKIKGPPSVNVDASPFGAISTNTCECSEIVFTCASNGSSIGSSISFAIAFVAGASTLAAFLVM